VPGEDLRARLAADRRVHVEDVGPDPPQDREHDPAAPGLDPDRDVPGVVARQVGRACGCEVHRDVGAGVAWTDDQHRPVLELGGVAVLARVQLDRARVEVGREVGDARALEGAGGDHDVAGLDGPGRGVGDEVPVDRGEALDARAGADLDARLLGVGLEVVGHLVLGREAVARVGEREAREAVVGRRGEDPQRVPALAPGVADALVGVDDDGGDAAVDEPVGHREAGLAAADDERADALALGAGAVGG
jgi:hypothetical protein